MSDGAHTRDKYVLFFLCGMLCSYIYFLLVVKLVKETDWLQRTVFCTPANILFYSIILDIIHAIVFKYQVSILEKIVLVIITGEICVLMREKVNIGFNVNTCHGCGG